MQTASKASEIKPSNYHSHSNNSHFVIFLDSKLIKTHQNNMNKVGKHKFFYFISFI